MASLPESRTTSHESRAYDVRAALKEAMGRLRAANVPSHTLAAELLLMHALGRDRGWLYAHPEAPLADAAAERYFTLVAQRSAGTPTQYLTGQQEFWGLEFEVAPGVLIPRPETEHVVEGALERIGPMTWKNELERRPVGKGVKIADVGTGSGCLAIALARELSGAEVFATDVSSVALALAKRNAERHGVGERVHFVQCSLLEGLDRTGERFGTHVEARHTVPLQLLHLIVSNPPYVGRREAGSLPREVREHEPAEALFGGEDGAQIYAPLIAQAARLLSPGGALVVELGYNSLERVRPLVENESWTRVSVTNDLAGIPRVLAAERV